MNNITSRSQALPAKVDRTGLAATLGRALIATIFILSGTSKIFDPASALGYIASAGMPFPKLALAVAIAIELIGGVALVVGYRTRSAAIILAGFSVATALAFHQAIADQNQFIHFFKNFAIAGGLLQVAAFGGGRFSLDDRGTAFHRRATT